MVLINNAHTHPCINIANVYSITYDDAKQNLHTLQKYFITNTFVHRMRIEYTHRYMGVVIKNLRIQLLPTTTSIGVLKYERTKLYPSHITCTYFYAGISVYPLDSKCSEIRLAIVDGTAERRLLQHRSILSFICLLFCFHNCIVLFFIYSNYFLIKKYHIKSRLNVFLKCLLMRHTLSLVTYILRVIYSCSLMAD